MCYDNNVITITVNGKGVTAKKGTPLSDIRGVEKPCGGGGKCGKCKVIATGALSPVSETEKRLLSSEELADGVRLACCTYAEGNCTVLPYSHGKKAKIMTDGSMSLAGLAPAFSRYGVAFDIGTTTLAAKLYDINGNVAAECSEVNPQTQYGGDVISRISASIGGKGADLAECIRGAANKMIMRLAEIAEISAKDIDAAVFTGNTAMLYLFCGYSPLCLSRAPFIADKEFGRCFAATELGITSMASGAEIYLPPCLGSFVGADTTCALLAVGMTEQKNTCLMADIGTNGEIALWHKGKLSVCSTAAGPAFEGYGISCGMRGEPGAVDKVSIDNGVIKCHVIGECDAVGICGSGLIDAAACMLKAGELEEGGYLETDPYPLKDKVSVTANDIRMLQLAKSAIRAGILTLMHNGSTDIEDIEVLYIAGGFGNYLNAENAEYIGLIPGGLACKIFPAGNAALGGASMLLLNRELRQSCSSLAENAGVAELSTDPFFTDCYVEGMLFGEE